VNIRTDTEHTFRVEVWDTPGVAESALYNISALGDFNQPERPHAATDRAI
jgi:hypothetical protein